MKDDRDPQEIGRIFLKKKDEHAYSFRVTAEMLPSMIIRNYDESDVQYEERCALLNAPSNGHGAGVLS